MNENGPDAPLPDALLDELLKNVPTREVYEYERRFGPLAVPRGPGSSVPPVSAKLAYDRYRAGDVAALDDLRAELQKAERDELYQHVAARMTLQEKRALLLRLGKAFLLALRAQRPAQLKEKISEELIELLLAVDLG